MAAFEDGRFAPLEWAEIQVDDVIVSVATDAMRGEVDGAWLRLPVSYLEALTILRALDCISPTLEMCIAMHRASKHHPQYVGLWKTEADSKRMATLGFTRTFNRELEERLAKLSPRKPSDLLFGPWKVWLLHPGIGVMGAVNHGFWDETAKPPASIQTQGMKHTALHYDYSQVLQPVKRWARKAGSGEPVDLLHWKGITSKIPARFLAPYELKAPGPETVEESVAASAANGVDLEAVLATAGLDVTAHPGWRTRGAIDFAPQGIMLHHTAGPKVGDAPSLTSCLNGRPDLSGPLCHLLIARSGEVHLIAGRRANHAGKGAMEVMAKLLAGEPVEGDAKDHGYADAASGGPSFYGIEVENDGVGEHYPDEQIRVLIVACAAICRAYGWEAKRIIHHRQWTQRKIDMSYKGEIVAAIADEMALKK